MSFNVEDMKAKVQNIARPTLFDVTIKGPAINALNYELLKFTCKGAQLPDSTIGKIEVPFFGRRLPFAGDRQYQDWSVNIILDGDYTIYKQLIQWQKYWNDEVANVGINRRQSDYKCDGELWAYDNTGKVVMRVKFVGLFPYQINSLDMNWESTDTASELSVQFFYDYYQVMNS